MPPGQPAHQRLWRTADGRLVIDGDPAAMTLAYAAGDRITEKDVEAYGQLMKPADTATDDDTTAPPADTPRARKAQK